MTTLEIFEKVNLILPIEQRRFFNYLDDTISELRSMYGDDFILNKNVALNFEHAISDNDSENDWEYETKLISKATYIKDIDNIQMYADISDGAEISVYVLYDDEVFDENTSFLAYQSTDYGKKLITIYPKKDYAYKEIKLHIVGDGNVKFYDVNVFGEYTPPKALSDALFVKPLYHNAIIENIIFAAGGDSGRKTEFLRKARDAYLSYWNENARGRTMKKARW